MSPTDIERVTSAPEVYDGFGTTTVEWLPWKSRGDHQFRIVRIPPEAQFGDWQAMRYGSGMYACIPRETFAEWVDLKLGVYPVESSHA